MDITASMLATQEGGSLAGQFSWIDWVVVFGYLIGTTVVGGALAGKQATIRDFFLGGRRLPWYAVTGSIIATEISAVTFVGVPAIVFARGGNFTYLQFGLLGSVLARIIVGYVLVPAYYKREIYSPYDYMGDQLGQHARTVTTCLFTLGGMLAQGARVYLTALILDLIIGPPVFGKLAEATGTETMTWSIYLIGLVAIAWTLLGGITTVIWTDVILFVVFFVGGFVALGFVIGALPGDAWDGVRRMWTTGYRVTEAGPWGKLTLFDFDLSPAREFTIWTALIANTFLCAGVFGTDQLMAQRMFCCRGPRQARRAIIASSASVVIAAVMLLVGLGLFVYYQAFPLTGEAEALVGDKTDRVFPVFIIQVLPAGVTGLLIAGIFAAAISSLDSILAALSQTTMTAFYLPWRQRSAREPSSADSPAESRRVVRASRILVVFWGIVLCLMAHVADAVAREEPDKYGDILRLALSMATYTVGALLAGFLLAVLRLNIDARGFMWSAPLSVFVVFATAWHGWWSHPICWAGAVVLLVTWIGMLVRERRARPDGAGPPGRNGIQTIVLVLGLVMMLSINYFGYLDTGVDETSGKVTYVTVAWPWFVPIGTTVAFVFGYLLARPAQPAQRERRNK